MCVCASVCVRALACAHPDAHPGERETQIGGKELAQIVGTASRHGPPPRINRALPKEALQRSGGRGGARRCRGLAVWHGQASCFGAGMDIQRGVRQKWSGVGQWHGESGLLIGTPSVTLAPNSAAASASGRPAAARALILQVTDCQRQPASEARAGTVQP